MACSLLGAFVSLSRRRSQAKLRRLGYSSQEEIAILGDKT
jgi:hypothetical protein